MVENGNGRIGHLLLIEPGEPDRLKVHLAVALRTAAMWYEQDGTDEAWDALVECSEDCLRGLLGREPTDEEVGQVLNREF